MGRKYENPPIVEALCEFRFDGTPWKSIYPGYIYKEIEKEYPIDRIARGFSLSPEGKFIIEQRFQFCKENEQGIIQINEHLLSVHLLNAYTSWNYFKYHGSMPQAFTISFKVDLGIG